jgi:hypothetical protein
LLVKDYRGDVIGLPANPASVGTRRSCGHFVELRDAPCSAVQDDFGIPRCPVGNAASLLSADSLQCWLAAPHGRWRRLNHQSHLEALVVEVEAEDLRDAASIAQRLVGDPMAEEFSEILVYVARPQGGDLLIRRVRWTRGRGYDTLDFSSRAADTPLTIRSSPGSETDPPQPKP